VSQAGERMLAEVAGLGRQIRETAAAVREQLPEREPPRAVALAGLGGSAIGADLALALWGGSARVPAVVVRGDTPPGWLGPGDLLVAVSYSGKTAETLACARRAVERGIRLVAVSAGGDLPALAREGGGDAVTVAGGLLPRVALGRLFAAVAVTLEHNGVIPGVAAELEEAAAASDDAAADGGGVEARDLGRALAGATAWIGGAGTLEAVARRWKTQLNENAKMPASYAGIPELAHNEIEGWAGVARAGGEHAAVFLTDPADPPRLRETVRRTAEVVGGDAGLTEILEGRGSSRTARALSLVAFGDCVSVHAAVAAGVDPFPIERLEALKRELAER
jgi:glucose/mannose-6-phosphate isomerase